MITLNQISLHIGSKKLLTDASVTINTGMRVGLIGANGVGKTSLFKLLLGGLEQDEGDLKITTDSISHAQQELEEVDLTALEYVLKAHTQYQTTLQAITDAQEDPVALALAYDQWAAIEGDRIKNQAEQILSGLGFQSAQFSEPSGALSGGWQARLHLAQALLLDAELLLLDEPTNHLDLDSTLWLMQWLKQQSKSLIVISHDRYFLNQITNHILHMDNQKLTLYKGQFDAFEKQRQAHMEQAESALIQQERQVKHLQQFIDRFRASANRSKQVQSRIKALGRMQSIEAIKAPNPFTFSFHDAALKANPLVTLKDVTLGYPEAPPTIKKAQLKLRFDARVGLLGANGQGKSTFMKYLAGKLEAIEGTLEYAAGISVGYFAQHQTESLDLTASPAVIMQRHFPEITEQQARNHLGEFGFRGDQVFENISHFSGGEKSRLALAILVWRKPNLLLLDEPTNHLDMDMCDALTVAIQGFKGALVIISHNYDLLNACTDEFYLVKDQKVSVFDGDLEDYKKQLMTLTKPSSSSNTNTNTNISSQDPKQDSNSKLAIDKKTQRQEEAKKTREPTATHQQIKKSRSQN